MHRRKYLHSGASAGFALLEVMIVCALVAGILAWTLLSKDSQTQKSFLETGVGARNQALQLKNQLEQADAQNQALINEFEGQRPLR